MSELLRKGLVGGSMLLIIGLLIQLSVSAKQAVPEQPASPTEHCAKQIDVYTVSQFNEMLQTYCQQFDLRAEYQGPLNPGAGRPGNRPLPNYDQYSTWIIVPAKPEKRTIQSRFHSHDWFTIGLCLQDQANYEVHLMGKTLFLNLPATYGKYTGQNTRLPIQMTVEEFMTGLSEYSRTWLTKEETMRKVWNLTDELQESHSEKK